MGSPTRCILLLALWGCDADYDDFHRQEPLDWLALRYGEPRAPDCVGDADCTNGCCKQVSDRYRRCYPGEDDACHIRWAEPPPSYLPRWDLSRIARYTGDFAADVVTARVVDVWGAGRSRIYKLDNGQYWEAIAPAKEPAVGDTVRIAPGPYMYNMDAGDISTSTDLTGVTQLPVVIDTQVMGTDFSGMEQDGLYALMGAGYWRVSEASASRERRVIITSPNNKDFWIYTASIAQNPANPAQVYGDGVVVMATSTEFTLDDGTRWSYMARPLNPVVMGERAVVFDLATFDDRHIDHALPHRYCWHPGADSGEWVSPL